MSFLPPASEGWRKVMFSLCPPFRGGYPIPGLWGGGTPARSGWWGGTPARSGWLGVPWPGLDGGGGLPQPGLDGEGVPQPGLDGWGYPGQVWMVGEYPSQVWMVVGGVTMARSGWWGVPQPGLVGEGVPQPGLDGEGVPQPGLNGGGGYPIQVWIVGGTQGIPWPGLDGGGVPWVSPTWLNGITPHHDWMGYPHHDWMEYPFIMTGWGTPPPSVRSTCYVAGGIPLAFTQEDFLFIIFSSLYRYLSVTLQGLFQDILFFWWNTQYLC